MSMRIGLDFGGVIVRGRDHAQGEDTRIGEGDGAEVANVGAFEAVSQLVSACDGGCVDRVEGGAEDAGAHT
ncbi:MAG: hypothetical protein IPK67_11355 [Planctomycetes bacterium]|nr:hypothetical protein [Planctomycetota bacterium]